MRTKTELFCWLLLGFMSAAMLISVALITMAVI